MSSYIEVVVLVEGSTEQKFIKEILAPYMYKSNISLTPIILDKPGEKGGDVKFSRAQNDIGRHLKQRSDTRVTLMVDYYGIKGDWPGYIESKQENMPNRKAEVMNNATAIKVAELFPSHDTHKRFIPYVSMHEIEALYFSDPRILAEKLSVKIDLVEKILKECRDPEKINNSSETAPSKRLESLCSRFKKTSSGIDIAKSIGIPKMREACPIFNAWIQKLEAIESFR